MSYLAFSNPAFPEPLDDVYVSNEPADIEDNLRRAYYTNYLREDVVNHYLTVFKKGFFENLSYPTFRLNYPPEEARILIRDQTRSTYLEEIVHPLRESIFVNGFEPTLDKDRIIIEGNEWKSKVIVRYVPSNILSRLFVGLSSIFLVSIIFKSWRESFLRLKDEMKKFI